MSKGTNYLISTTNCVSKKTYFAWKICDYYQSPLKNNGFLLSEFFVFENARFCLKAQYVYVDFRSVDSSGPSNWLSICIIDNGTLPDVDFTCIVSLKNKKSGTEYQKRCFVQRGKKPAVAYLVKEVNVSNTSGVLVDDCLSLSCCLVSHRSIHKSNFSQPEGTVSCLSCTGALSRDLWRLFTSKDKTDFVLRVKGQDIPVHSQILVARSSVFAAMFRHDFRENRTRIVYITDMGISEVKYLMQYIYTGEVQELKELTPDSLADLYGGADKYDLKELKDMCSQVMQATLSKENVDKYATLALTYDDQNIMAAVVALFGSNKDLIDSDLMQDLTKRIPALPVQILKFVAKGM